MPQYSISTITGVSPDGTLSADEFARHLAASPWQPATSHAIREPWAGGADLYWALAFTAHVGTMPVHGRLGSNYNYLVLDGSIEAVSQMTAWYRRLIPPAFRLALVELPLRERSWVDLTPETTVAEINQALTARLQIARSSPTAAATHRQRVVQRQQKRLVTILDDHGGLPAALTVLHDTGTEVTYGVTVPASEALDHWRRLRALVSHTHHWPVLLGEEGLAGELISDLEARQNRAVADIVREGQQLDPRAVLAAAATAGFKRPTHDWEVGRLSDALERWPWPEEGEVWRRRSRFAEEVPASTPVVLALVPTHVSWEVPAVLRWGGWNWCPMPEQQVAILKSWLERYGAEVVTMMSDTLELQAQRLPASRDEALALAWEHLASCADIDEVGYTIEDLAKLLLVSPVWTFWWD